MKNQFFNYHLLAFCTILLTAISSFQVNAQQRASGSEIKFAVKTYKQVLATARTSHKMVFVDAYATWCAPCGELRATTFKDARAAAYFNRHFINYSVDVEKGEGIDLAKSWQIEGLPTLLILDGEGKIIANHTGFVDGNGLMQFAREAAESSHPGSSKAVLNK